MAFTPITIGKQKGVPSVSFQPIDQPSPTVNMAAPESLGSKIIGGATAVTDALGLHGAVDSLGSAGAAAANPKQYGEGLLPVPGLKQGIGTGLQLGSIAAPGAGAGATLPARLATGAVTGAAGLGGQAAAENQDAGTIAKQTGIGAGAGLALSAAGEAVKGIGKGIYKFIIPRSSREAQLLQTYQANNPLPQRIAAAVTGAEAKAPTTAAETSFQKGLIGTEEMIGVQAKRAGNNLWKDLIHPQLEASPEKVSMPSFFDDLEKTIVAHNPEPSRQNALMEGLQALKEDYAKIGEVPMTDLQKFKEGWAQFIPDKAYKGKPIAGAFAEVKNLAADQARQKIYDALGSDVKQAYFDYGNLKGLQELGQKAMAGGRLKGGAGSFISGIRDMVLTPVGTLGGQGVYKIGRGIELYGPPGLQTVGDLIQSMTGASQSAEPEAKSPQTPVATASFPQPTANPPKKLMEVDKNGIITIHGLQGRPDTKLDPTAIGGAGVLERVGAEKLAQIAKKLHPDDVQRMIAFTESVVKKGKKMFDFSPKQELTLLTDAHDLWARFFPNIKPPKTAIGIANDFGRLLDHVKTK